ncbi:MAG TPA: quinol:electron acceptor oxidoreductase subunit ActD [Kofleriaceae bacterium]|nr:quinol:electron acceptor oxidoreductase subunit ActD [Kofleriaceae bacterium]
MAHDEHTTHQAATRDGALYGVLAEFDTPGELVDAARKVRNAGYTEFDCFSPFPVHGIDEAMGIKRTILPLLVFGGGFTGLVGGIFLQWWMNAYNWPWNISGKPAWSIPANVPIAFETTILLSVFTTFFGMWIMNKLPQVWHPFFRQERFGRVTDDAFLLGIEARDRNFDSVATMQLLRDAGALAVDTVHYEADPRRKTMPKWIFAFIVSSTAFALIPLAIAAKARNSFSSEPHIHVFPDMDYQPKFKADTASDLFADGRANRGEIAGTVPRGALKADDLFYRGIENGQWTTGLPKQLEVNEQLIRRGQTRYNIYCAPCHGYDGQGKGAIPQRVAQLGGAWEARNLVATTSTSITMPNGQLFNTISNGYNTMMGYAQQIPHADRWAIVLYVRAMQRSQNAAQGELQVNDAKCQNMSMPAAPSAASAPAAGGAGAGSAAGSGSAAPNTENK